METPGEFMQSDMEGDTLYIKMEGRMVDILTNLDPKMYRKHVTTKKGRTVLYTELNKSLYVTL